MASMTLKGLYLKDTPWRDVPGTWTGVIELCGNYRLVVAVELKRIENGNRIEPAHLYEGDGEPAWLWTQMMELAGYDPGKIQIVEADDGTPFFIFMPPG